MIRSLYTSVSGLITQEAKQNVITNNLANVNTVGFKGDNLSVKKFNDVLIENYDKQVNGKNVRNVIGSLSNGSGIDGVKTSFTQGMLESTDKWSDFAIEGRGFFAVRKEVNGAPTTFYSRDGHFHVNGDGVLVNNSGDKILAEKIGGNGQLTEIKLNKNELSINTDGTFQLQDGTYRFATADFADYNSLRKVGDNLYSGENPQQGEVTVRQKSLEKSNINVMNEMVNMMTVMRSFESNQKMIQAIDETLGKAVNEVGSVR